jgi:hypothetical protein
MLRPHTRTLRHSLSALLARTRDNATREATRRLIAPLPPALRDDLGLTHDRQSIKFQNDIYQKHSFD